MYNLWHVFKIAINIDVCFQSCINDALFYAVSASLTQNISNVK